MGEFGTSGKLKERSGQGEQLEVRWGGWGGDWRRVVLDLEGDIWKTDFKYKGKPLNGF